MLYFTGKGLGGQSENMEDNAEYSEIKIANSLQDVVLRF
jgi:hypothetical protein